MELEAGHYKIYFKPFFPLPSVFKMCFGLPILWCSDSIELGLVFELLVKCNGHLGLQRLNAFNEV